MVNSTTARPWVHVLKAGPHRDMHGNPVSFTAGDLSAIAANYRPERHPAPVVIGHPTTNGPAFGWITAFAAYRGELEAELDRLDPAFVAAVREGRYQTRSISLYPPEHPQNPRPGAWYPRHLGFLGGMPPAVKGMRPAELASADCPLCELASPLVPPPDVRRTAVENLEARLEFWREYWKSQAPEVRKQRYRDYEHADEEKKRSPDFWIMLGIRPYRDNPNIPERH